MNTWLKKELIGIAKQNISSKDTSHDFEHALRVMVNAEMIAKKEKSDLDIIIPATLFHDLVNYPKNNHQSKNASTISATKTKNILAQNNLLPIDKISKICRTIEMCSFSKGVVPDFIEAKILQDADGIEATGAISIMRTFASTGQMQRTFYHSKDPFCINRKPDDLKYAIDLFYTRLLKIEKRMHTTTAKKIVRRRTKFLYQFLRELGLELKGY